VTTAFAVGAAGVLVVVVGSSGAQLGSDHVDNTGFRKGLHSWDRTVAGQRVDRVTPGYDGSRYAARLRTVGGRGSVVLDDQPNSVRGVERSQTFVARAYVRTTEPSVSAALRVRELSSGVSIGSGVDTTRLRDRGWDVLRVRYTTKSAGSALDLTVRGADLGRRQDLLVDRVTIRKVVKQTRQTSASGTALPPVCGTWVLQQASSAAELDRMRGDLRAALATPGVRGLSVRAPWNAIDGNLGVFNEALDIARAAGKPLSIRVMAGRHTPARVFQAGAYSYVDSRGERIPKPFSDNGSAGNPVFEREYEQMVAGLAGWSRSHGVRLLHLSWYGHLWAEIDNGEEIQRSRGYSLDAWATGHLRLLDIGMKYAKDGLSVEYPMSGYWGGGGSAAGRFFDRITTSAGQWTPRVFLQGNAHGKYNYDPVGSRPIYHGLQMFDGGQYDWASAYAFAKTAKSTYLEVYSSSFQGPRADELASEARSFSSRFDASCQHR
jgi:hypothetical protein